MFNAVSFLYDKTMGLILLITLIASILLSCGMKKSKKELSQENPQAFKLGDLKPTNTIKLSYLFPSDIRRYLDTCKKPWANQKAGTDYSFIGMETETGEQFYGRYGKPKALSDSAFTIFQKSFLAVNAMEYILERAKNEEVLIINEAHHKPKHRFFTRSLLNSLYEQGYRYLGLETLSNRETADFELNIRKYPLKYSGTYSNEPQFGNLIREALEIGYMLFPYEGEGNGKPREINQAKNIAAFMKTHTDGKYLIHCVDAHATEGPIKGSWEKAMAGS
jgi:hypothetical protein